MRDCIVVLVSESPEIGAGHFSRQFTLARELQLKGLKICFVGQLSKSKQAIVSKAGFGLSPLVRHDSITQHAAALKNLGRENSIKAVVIDNYAILKKRKSFSDTFENYPEVHFQDGPGALPGGEILVNSGIAELTDLDHRKYRKNFLGYGAVILGQGIIALKRARDLERGRLEPTSRGFVNFGMSDQTTIAISVLKWLEELGTEFALSFEMAVREEPDAHPVMVASHENSRGGSLGYFQALRYGDYAIGAAGLSSFERAFLAIPSINLALTPNQHGIANLLESSGAAMALFPGLGEFSFPIFESKLREMSDPAVRAEMRAACIDLIRPTVVTEMAGEISEIR